MSKGGTPTIPTNYTFTLEGATPPIQVDTGLDNIKVTQMPTFEIAVTQFPQITSNINVDKLPLISSQVAITEIPTITSNVNLAVTQIPEQRVHLPSHYQVCFSLFGVELWSLLLCGETQAINENYVARRTEKTCS
jgi:hypothetical protein